MSYPYTVHACNVYVKMLPITMTNVIRPHSCVADIEQQHEFSLSIGYNDINCDVEMDTESGRVETEIILQHHDKILTSGDIGLHVSCVYNINSSVVYQAMDLGEELPNR